MHRLLFWREPILHRKCYEIIWRSWYTPLEHNDYFVIENMLDSIKSWCWSPKFEMLIHMKNIATRMWVPTWLLYHALDDQEIIESMDFFSHLRPDTRIGISLHSTQLQSMRKPDICRICHYSSCHISGYCSLLWKHIVNKICCWCCVNQTNTSLQTWVFFIIQSDSWVKHLGMQSTWFPYQSNYKHTVYPDKIVVLPSAPNFKINQHSSAYSTVKWTTSDPE